MQSLTPKQTPLSFAAKHDHGMVVSYLLLTDGVDPESRDSDGRTPLSLAAGRWKVEVVRMLLDTNGVGMKLFVCSFTS
jgi:ankyrin repeat protein